jgi:tripartite-type tricarboxylate transporter receptor subunit TctC
MALAATSAALVILAPAAMAQYPERTVTLIVPFAPGGSGDTTMRVIADHLAQRTGAQVVVENRAGGGGTIGMSALARSAPDGYTLGLVSTSPFTVIPHFQQVPYEPVADFTFVVQYTINPAPMFVVLDSPFESIEQLLDFGRENPGGLSWATGAPRGTNHISTEAALKQEGVEAQFVPFTGGSEAITSLLSGDLDFVVLTDFGPLLANDQIRLLAESGPTPIPGHPDVRTYTELGFPVSMPIFLGIGAPAGIPDEVVAFWEEFMAETVEDEGFRSMLATYQSVPEVLDSAAFTQRIVDAHAATGETVATLGMTAN